MTRARHPLPTDLVALISHDGRIFPNEAKTWDRMGADQGGPHPLGAAVEQWLSFATGKHTWVSVRGATIRGLISARRRAKRSAWEVDCLINAEEDADVAMELLDRMAVGAAREKAERIFLRLNADSRMVEIARVAGFFAYSTETLYRSDEPTTVNAPTLPFRPRTKADSLGIYQLYNAASPANVRAIEGATLKEWQAAHESWGSHPSDLVLEEDGLVSAWLRLLHGQEGRFTLLVHPKFPDAAACLDLAVHKLQGSRPLLCLAPSWAEALARPLCERGFSPIGQYVSMAKRTTKLARDTAPKDVGTAVPVS